MLACLQAKFITEAQALLHGDMHTGSLMVTQDTTYAIDAEFAVYGPMAFDVGKFLANLLLAFFALDGHCSGGETRSQQRQWLLQVRVDGRQSELAEDQITACCILCNTPINWHGEAAGGTKVCPTLHLKVQLVWPQGRKDHAQHA